MISRSNIAFRFFLIISACILLEMLIFTYTNGDLRVYLTLALILLAYLATYLLSGSIHCALMKFAEIIRKIASKKYDNILIKSNSYFKYFSEDLTIIQNRLKRYNNKLSRNKEGFNLIIETLKEAIWIQNEKGLITDGNSSFKKLINNDNIKGQYFWNVIRPKELYKLADLAMDKTSSFTKEVKFDGSSFLCSASYSPLLEETIFIVYDMTEIRKLEILKKDLVLNVSHELRTPLTSIKGYLETIEEELPGEQQPYLKIIKRNTDRLINIVQDLLTLSKLEHVQKIEVEKTRTYDFLLNIAAIFQQTVEKKSLKLNIEADSSLPYFWGDRFKLEQVFINLIDNAITYTETGTITIKAKQVDNEAIFEVIDRGAGIPLKSLPRLFDRFYVVDKSRNRKLGGTGLGLSIVKHIINLHNGAITVESRINEGTKFTITLPMEKN